MVVRGITRRERTRKSFTRAMAQELPGKPRQTGCQALNHPFADLPNLTRGGLFRWKSEEFPQPPPAWSALCGWKVVSGKMPESLRTGLGNCRRAVAPRHGRLRQIADVVL